MARPLRPWDDGQWRPLRSAAAEAAGTEPAVGGGGGWTLAAVFAGAGIPAVRLGASRTGAHAPEEWVELGSVVRLARTLAGAARRFWEQRAV